MGLEPGYVHVLFTLRVVVAPSPGHAPLSALVGSQTSSHGPFCALILSTELAMFVVFAQV